MSNPEFKDSIFYTQKVAKDIDDADTLKLFKNPNLMCILALLRGQYKAMTVPDFVQAFIEESEKNDDINAKSEKTIYRYLGELIDGGLVVKGGKRIFPESENLKTQTLYMRTAKIFFPIKSESDYSEEENHKQTNFNEILTRLVTTYYRKEVLDESSLHEFVKNMNVKRYELARTIIKNADEESAEKLSQLDWPFVESLLENLTLLAILLDDMDWNSELKTLFKGNLEESSGI
jgi:hypothetical protein